MSTDENDRYTVSELATRYQISNQQARRHIARFGNLRQDLDLFLSSAARTSKHRSGEIERSATEVAYG